MTAVDLKENLLKSEVELACVKAAHYPFRSDAPKNVDYRYFNSKSEWEKAVEDAEAAVYGAYECLSNAESGLK